VGHGCIAMDWQPDMGGRRILSDAQIHEMAELREAGRSYDWIAAHFTSAGTPIASGTIAWQCLRLGIIAPHYTQASVGRKSPGRGRAFTPAEDQRLLELSDQGVSRREIARALDRRPNSIRARLYTLARCDAVAEECPPSRPLVERNRAAVQKHRRIRQLANARAKVARLEREVSHVQ